MLDKLVDVLVKSVQDGQWSVGAFVVVVAVVVNLRAILEFFERRGSRREEFVKEALKIEVVRDAARSFLEEELNYLVFKRVTGISADRPLREKIKSLVEQSRGELQTFQFARARKFIKMKEGKLSIQIGRFDKVEQAFNWVSAVFVAIFAMTGFVLPVLLKGATLQNALLSLGFGVLMFFFSLFLVAQTIPMSVARRIQPVVEKLESPSSARAGS